MKGDFSLAVHALVYLDCKKAILSSEQLAENVCTNPVRVRKIMARLKKAGLISTREGKHGGYLFFQDAAKTNLLTVFDAVDNAVVSQAWRSGDEDLNCLISSGMAGVMEDIYADLDGLCKQALSKITLSDIEGRIFKKEKHTE